MGVFLILVKEGRIVETKEKKVMETLLKEFLDKYCYVEDYKGNLTGSDWRRYYDFINAAYKVPRGVRPTVSELAYLFQSKQIPESGSLAMLYAHGLYILARSDNLDIFKGGFNY
jgi:hypothetical protein